MWSGALPHRADSTNNSTLPHDNLPLRVDYFGRNGYAELERGLGTRCFEQVWNKGNRAPIAEMLAPDAVLHEGGNDSIGPEGVYAFYDRLTAAFSDFHVIVQDTIVEGDRACVRWRRLGHSRH